MPHFNILFPFIEEKKFNAILPDLRNKASNITPFQVELREFKCFQHSKSNVTGWLHPSMDSKASQELNDFYEAMRIQFPKSCRGAKTPSPFTPHLSVGSWTNTTQMTRDIRAALDPIDFDEKTLSTDPAVDKNGVYGQLATALSWEVDCVYVISRDSFTAPFQIQHILPLSLTTSSVSSSESSSSSDSSLNSFTTVSQQINDSQRQINITPNPQNKHGAKQPRARQRNKRGRGAGRGGGRGGGPSSNVNNSDRDVDRDFKSGNTNINARRDQNRSQSEQEIKSSSDKGSSGPGEAQGRRITFNRKKGTGKP